MTTALVNQNVSLVSPEPVQCPSEKKNKKIKVPEVPCMTRMFLKGEPLALGTMQIMVGIIMVAMGAITWFTQILYGEIPLVLGLSFIFSGSVTLGAHKGTYPPIIKSAVALNIISALLAMSGICYFCFAFTVQHDLESCVVSDGSFYMRYSDCEYRAEILKELIYGIKGILLILSTLELCVCTTTVVVSCKANVTNPSQGTHTLSCNHTHYRQFRDANQPTMHVFEPGEETPTARGEHANSTHTAEAGIKPSTLEGKCSSHEAAPFWTLM